MAINPLIIFASLSVVTVGGIVVVQQVNKPAPIEHAQKQTAPVATPLLEPKTKADKTPVQKLAAIEPKKFPAAKLDSKDLKALTKPNSMAPVAPSFDVVRVEKDGGAVVVGKAAPNAIISLKLNGKVIGKTKSNTQGDWVFIPDQLIPSGNHELVIESKEVNKKPVRSKQSIFIAISKNTNVKPLVVVASPNAPTKVLQVPDAKPVKAAERAKDAKPTKIAKAETKTPAKSSTISPQVSTPNKGGETIIKQATPQTVAKKVATLPKAVTPPIANTPKKSASIAKTPKANTPLANSAVPTKRQKLVFGTVDYNDKGNIVFSGKATAGKTVRLYIDNKVIGDAKADENGHWVFKGKKSIRVGLHELRADQLTTTGSVAQRTAVPFMRAAPRKVAALIENRGKTSNVKNPTQAVKKTPQPITANSTTNQPTASVSKVPTPQTPATNPPSKPALAVQNTHAPTVVQAPQPTVKTVAKPVMKDMDKAEEKAGDKSVVTQQASNEKKTDNDKPKLVSHVVIQPGNNLWNISRVIYGKGVAYTTIYQANKTQVKDPNRIYPGQILETPGAMSTGSIGPDERGNGEGVGEKG